MGETDVTECYNFPRLPMKKAFVFCLVIILLAYSNPRITQAAPPMQAEQLYVAKTEALCTGYSNCFFNDTADLPESNALAKAIKFSRDNSLSGAVINVLAPYEINSHPIQVDYPVTIVGKNSGWISTPTTDCSRPMFIITAQATIQDIYLNDGSCSSPSRDLIVVNSASPVSIEHSTLENGKIAVTHQGGTGSLSLRFNHINANQTALESTNTDPLSNLLLAANNIINNGSSSQVVCARPSSVDHNYWGVGIMPSLSSSGCGVDDEKRLDAPIVTETTGVAARLQNLTSSFPSTDFYGFKASSPTAASLYVVNHGTAIPFTGSAGSLYACSNAFDVFLPSNASPSSITLSLTYRSTNDCAPLIESAAFCGSGNQTKIPLLWYDPKTQVTDKWDKTGDKPQTPMGNIFSGQDTTCKTASKTIEVVLDNDGRPDLLNDLFFTPFVIGFEQAGVLAFTATSTTSQITINWTTITESNTLGFYLTRATTIDGSFEKITGDINATGSDTSGSSYAYADSSVVSGQTYYYKLVVLNDDGSVQQTTAPISAALTSQATSTVTATATRTLTPTRTLTRTPTRTLTPTYRTPTPFLTATQGPVTALPVDPTLSYPTSSTFPEAELTTESTVIGVPTETPHPENTHTLTPTPTLSDTPQAGILDKTDRYSRDGFTPLYLGGAAVLALGVLIAIHLHRKNRFFDF